MLDEHTKLRPWVSAIGISAVSPGPGISLISPENKSFFSDKRYWVLTYQTIQTKILDNIYISFQKTNIFFVRIFLNKIG